MAWSVVTLANNHYLAFLYTDRQAGPSGKGVPLAGPRPTAEEARSALSPKATVRIGPQVRVEPLTAGEIGNLSLPDAPDWIRTFGGVGPWRKDERLAKLWQPGFVDDLPALFHLSSVRKVERMWVRLMRARPEVDGYEGVLINSAVSDATLTSGTLVTVRVTPGSADPVWLAPVTEKNLREWSAQCAGCGFDLILEPVQELVRRQFPAIPIGNVMEAFTTRCALCGQQQMIQKRGSPAELLASLHGAAITAAESPPPKAKRRAGRFVAWTVGVIAAGAAVAWAVLHSAH